MIKTWQQRCDEHPDHDGIVSEGMIQARMQEEIDDLRDAMEQAHEPVAWISEGGDVSRSKRYMDEMGFKCNPLYTAPRQWQGLTDEDVKAPIQRAMQHFGYDSTQYSLGGLATIGFLGLVKEIEAKLRERNA